MVRGYCGISKQPVYLVFSFYIRRTSAWSSIHSSVCFYVRKAAPYSIIFDFLCFYSSAIIMAFRSSASFLPLRRSFSALPELFRLSGFPKLRSVFALIAPLWRTFGAIFASTFFLDLLLHSRSRLNLRLSSSCLLGVHLSLYWSYVRCTPTSLSPFCT